MASHTDTGKIVVPYEPLPELPAELVDAILRQGLRVNERYLTEVVEEYAFCPYSRGGRRAGATCRYLYYADNTEVEGLLDLMVELGADTARAVHQVIFAGVEVDAKAWRTFCHQVTEAGNRRMGERDVLAVAALHPTLTYNNENPFALIPLFRRSPDPTIQWVRLDGLAKIYKGREGQPKYIDPGGIAQVMAAPPPRPSLYDRIAEGNREMAARLGVDTVEKMLAEIAEDGRRSYADILIRADDAIGDADRGRPPRGYILSEEDLNDASRAQSEAEKAAEVENGDDGLGAEQEASSGRVRVATWAELRHAEPKRARVAGIELVVFRWHDEPRAFYGRCPHRRALLADGEIVGDNLVCPSHGWEFDADSGADAVDRDRGLIRFKCTVDEGDDGVYVDADEVATWRQENPSPFFRDEYVGA